MVEREIIRSKRDRQELPRAEIDAFVQGLTSGSWGDEQVGAMAMAMYLNGLSRRETVDLTLAMMHSGSVIDWAGANLPGPVLDKHSTGGVGDKVSLMLAPVVAACGGFVPMISGRALGHTGGTLDKVDSIPGYQSQPGSERLREVLAACGCAIIGQTAELAPADRRLYAVRDATSTVESVSLITASILSKKLAAGLQGLVLDVKTGNGAFAPSHAMATELGTTLIEVAAGAGLPARAWVTDMNQVLGDSCGNALEVQEAVAFLQGRRREPRLLDVTRRLSAELLLLGGLAQGQEQALQRVDAALDTGAALEHFARMVAALGGPVDLVERATAHLPRAALQLPVRAARSGWVDRMATRDIGLLIVALGGGRRHSADRVDPRVGFSQFVQIGQRVEAGELLALVHAADTNSGAAAAAVLPGLIGIAEQAPTAGPVLVSRLRCAGQS